MVELARPHQRHASAPRRRRGLRLFAVVAGVLAVLLAVTAAVGYWLWQRDPVGDEALSGPIPERTVAPLRHGVFVGTEPADADAFAEWFGADVDLVVDFSTRQTWEEIADPAYMIEAWQNTGYQPVYSIALLPEGDASATIEKGATGEYNDYYRQLAQNLVDAGQGSAILRLGWEFNLETSRWSTPDSGAFVAYWRQVTETMRSVPGQDFEFDWNPNNGKNKYDAVEYYPGDDYVDYVGIDAYDVSYAWRTYPYPDDCDAGCRADRQERAWDKAIFGGKRGLEFWADFARHRGKPLTLPEWGLWDRDDEHAGGLNAYYIEQMHDFIADPANGVAYQAYFEFNGHDGPHKLMTTYQEAGETFRTLFADQ
ncbi:hypothetical protein Kisp01_12820 [Kineosporia sp. NBRC 101677]|uniref:glycosyl hydrolase n=1 Tax=Kineosporia sp. NBRC 101677 TaxID=3032197 RepID=UPI0024A09D99|nr:glycosyl hydrolase [Kineosporia sp. NBRC 101677]GLY14266.1 hypothetical protein Kisp01_12820 [Kineosporia sp. NBRC 101677]